MSRGSAEMYVSYRFEHPSEAIYHYKLKADQPGKSNKLFIPAKVEERRVSLFHFFYIIFLT